MLNGAVHIVELVVGLGLVIFVHELGHFLAAKVLGIKAERFSLGFGPRVLGFNWGGTDCRLSLIPLGGYVLLPGETPDDSKSEDPSQLSNRPVWQRIVVFSAGVFMNVVLSMILFAVAFSMGVRFPAAVVGVVTPGSPAAEAGLQRGDEIVGVNGERDVDLEDVLMAVAFTNKDEPVSLTVLREGEELPVTVVPEMDDEAGFPTIGITAASDTVLLAVEAESAADRSGLEVGDRVLTLDGQAVFDFTDVEHYLSGRGGSEVRVGIEREGETLEKTVQLKQGYALEVGIAAADPLVVGSVMAGSAAEAGGVKAGDAVISVDGVRAETTSRVGAMVSRKSGEGLSFLLLRQGKEVHVTLAGRRGPHSLRPLVGVVWGTERSMRVGSVVAASPLGKAGLVSGDVITSVNGKKVESWDGFYGFMGVLAEGTSEDEVEVRIGWRHGEEAKSAEVTLKRVEDPYGVEPLGTAVHRARLRERQYSLTVAPWMGLKKTVVFMQRIYLTLRGIGTRRVSPGKALGGPVLIAQIAYRAASVGVTYLMYFLAMIGVNLAVFNFLPVPFLDGGHVMLALVEKVRGKPLSRRMYETLSYIGLGLILLLAVLVTLNDIRRVMGGG